MAQLFPRWSNTLARVIPVGGVLTAAALTGAGYAFYFSPLDTGVGVEVEQTVPFSHAHHVAGLGIDCRYCHTSVETSRFAGIPPTETCMTCHSQVWRDAPMLQPVRDSWMQQKPLHWNRVNDLPDYVYFDHSIHVAKGVRCVECHGRVDQMPLMSKGQSLFMRWCLDCHRAPAERIGPRDAVFDMSAPTAKSASQGDALLKARHIQTERLSDCSICHR
jgi:hypothetical protein